MFHLVIVMGKDVIPTVTQVKYRYQIRVIVSISFEHDCGKLVIAQ